MNFSTISFVWANLNSNSKIIILTEDNRFELADKIKKDNLQYVSEISIIDIDHEEYASKIKALTQEDLVIALFTINGFINKNYRNTFSPFNKPLDIKSKYIFFRLDIPEISLLEGLNTDFEIVKNTAERLKRLKPDSKVKVTTEMGTNIITKIKHQEILPYDASGLGGFAFLPAAEVSEDLYEDSTNGIIVVDVTVGELRINGVVIDEFGLVDTPVTIRFENGFIKEIAGGNIANRLRNELLKLDNRYHFAVELGHGLSNMKPTGIIGVDESIIGTCHIGVCDRNPYHLDLVINNPTITVIEE